MGPGRTPARYQKPAGTSMLGTLSSSSTATAAVECGRYGCLKPHLAWNVKPCVAALKTESRRRGCCKRLAARTPVEIDLATMCREYAFGDSLSSHIPAGVRISQHFRLR
jgi:hypothetical protein